MDHGVSGWEAAMSPASGRSWPGGRKVAGVGVRWWLAAVFVYAGAVKLADPLMFVSDIEAYRLVAGWPAWVAAVYLPWLEIVVGLGLLWPRASRASAGVIAGLMVVFTAALVSAWWRGLDLRCGCFGDAMAGWGYGRLLVRDVVLLTAAGYCLRARRSHDGSGLDVGCNDCG